MPPRMCRYDVETPSRSRDYAAVAATAGRDKPREARQFGVGVRGVVEQVALRARVHHEAINWLILTDCSNAFKDDGSACRGGHLSAGTVLAEVAT